jgi:hypothetical protein
MRIRKKTAIVIVGIATIIGGTFYGLSFGGAGQAAGPAPDSVAALKALPPVSAPLQIAQQVQTLAPIVHTDTASATAALRRLLRRLGPDHGDLYAFPTTDGGVCVILSDRGTICPTIGASADQRVTQWALSGGYLNSEGVTLPTEIFGVVGDEVRSVTFDLNGTEVAVPIKNNAYFYDVGDVAPGTPWVASLQFKYADGHVRVQRVPNPLTGD